LYLSRLFIKNYRSIRELDLEFSKGKNIIVGRNNSGKSNIIKAIDIVLGEKSPTYDKSENIGLKDFYSWKEDNSIKGSKDIFIWCELTRDAGEQINYDEMNKYNGFYICTAAFVKGAPRLFPNADLPKNYMSIFEINENNSNKYWINASERENLEDQFEDKFNFAYAFRARIDDEDNIIKEIRFLYREKETQDWILSFRASIRKEFLQSAILSSFRDPYNELRLTKWTWYGKLIHHLTSESSKTKELIAAFEGVKCIGDEIFEEIKEHIESSSLAIAFPGTELKFQFNVDSKEQIYKNCLIYVDDGFLSQLTEKGSGIQSSTIIGLFNYYTRFVNTVTSALMCIEEPELYLHPHGCRIISDNLDDFLEGNRNQVILTTHSIDFIRTTQSDLNIIMVHKEKGITDATKVNIEKYRRILIDKNQNEIFFADKVIICEGFDHFIISAIAKELYPRALDEKNISVIAVGGKDSIDNIVKLILKLKIKCFILTDFDYLLRESPRKSIMNLGKDFFEQDCIFGCDGRNILAKIERLRSRLKGIDENLFENAKTSDCFDEDEIPRLLKLLRSNGVCVLSGEIENCLKDETFLKKDTKLSLEKIYELNDRLVSGTEIADIFDISEINDFLNVVLVR
jgi:putative ATP-dependent endonuclease of the OLD family